ncbi:MAG: glycosyl transferase family 2, partial [Burkholderiales bacterium]
MAARRIVSVLVSVVVPTWRRPALLARCLDALLAQTLQPSLYEIVVADDAPEEAVRERVERLRTRARCELRYVAVRATQGAAGARNAGWRAARGEIVAFTDDDTIPDRGWLLAGLRALAGGASAVTGRVEMPLPPRPTDYEKDAAGLTRAEFVTANCFVRRDVLERIGGFDERFTSAWR